MSDPQKPALTPEREAEICPLHPAEEKEIRDWESEPALNEVEPKENPLAAKYVGLAARRGGMLRKVLRELDRLRLAMSEAEGAANPRCGHPMSAIQVHAVEEGYCKTCRAEFSQECIDGVCSLCAELQQREAAKGLREALAFALSCLRCKERWTALDDETTVAILAAHDARFPVHPPLSGGPAS